MPLIECCLNNVSADTRAAIANSDEQVRETICLDRCGECYDQSFLVVDAELRTGKSHRNILQSLDVDDQEAEI